MLLSPKESLMAENGLREKRWLRKGLERREVWVMSLTLRKPHFDKGVRFC